MRHKGNITTSLVKVVGTLALILVMFTPASADLDCLAGSRGDTLKWRKSWQNDGRDNDVGYTVVATSEQIRKGKRIVTMELSANTNGAVRARRVISVADIRTASKVCKRLSIKSFLKKKSKTVTIAKRKPSSRSTSRNSPLRIPIDPPDPSKSKKRSTEFEGLPFIRYTSNGWIRADRKQGDQTILARCDVLGRAFSCAEEEKQRYEEKLDDIEAEAEVSP